MKIIMKHHICILFVLYFISAGSVGAQSAEKNTDAASIVKEALDYWRGQSSYTEAQMNVHRPDFERTMELVAWTKDTDHTLVRFVAPKKDAGSATLTVHDSMWSFSPKTNRIIKIPPSMMSQSWMGSDFSHRDLSKSDSIVRDYDHTLLKTENRSGMKVYIIQSIPKPDAAVVWGREVLEIREDKIILKHEFYDQDSVLIKVFSAEKIELMGDRLYATQVKMTRLDQPDEWTSMHYKKADFGLKIPESVFTQANLKNTSR